MLFLGKVQKMGQRYIHISAQMGQIRATGIKRYHILHLTGAVSAGNDKKGN